MANSGCFRFTQFYHDHLRALILELANFKSHNYKVKLGHELLGNFKLSPEHLRLCFPGLIKVAKTSSKNLKLSF